MPFPIDPGYGPNGERIDPAGLVVWNANPPPEVWPPVDDVWIYFALGETTVPFIDQNDDEGAVGFYLGGVP